MSTPIQQLQNAAPPPTAEVPQDPEVLNVLTEMEQEVAAATRSHVTHQAPPPPPPVPSMPAPMRPAPVMMPPPMKPQRSGLKALYHPELVQKTAILTLIALVLFYPSTMQFLYAKVPQYEAVFNTYDVLIRGVVFAILVYVFFLKFNV